MRGGKWLTQSYPTCYREWHKSLLITDGKGLEDWREADDAEKAAWERNPPEPILPDNPLLPLLTGAGLTYNERTGYLERNGVVDLTVDDGIKMIKHFQQFTEEKGIYCSAPIRTNLTFPAYAKGNGMCFRNLCSECTNLEVFDFGSVYGGTDAWYMFSNCRNLREIKGRWAIASVLSTGDGMFNGCVKLESLGDLVIASRVEKLSLKPCLNLRRESLEQVVELAQARSTALSLAVHPDVYAKLTGDTTNPAAAALTPDDLALWSQLLATAAAKSIIFTM